MSILSLDHQQRRRVGLSMALAALALLGGCATKPKLPPGVHPSVTVGPPPKSEAWKAVATAADQDRIARLGLAWQEALDEAKKTNGTEIRDEGRLLLPRAALPKPAPTPGSYNCRLIELGKATPKGKPFVGYKPFFCYVQLAGDQLTIVKQTGSERPAGALWEDDDPDRMIFLGSQTLGDEEQPLAYGDDPKRNMAGVFERIGAFRWRLVIPWPQSDAKLDVFELTPVDFNSQPR
ncbi:MAG TPA: DUF4893 domain-containing protein [Sphingomicrobium sp.]|nr:DUF4893 domain-containing protein [Sphingomicrobium sp.]